MDYVNLPNFYTHTASQNQPATLFIEQLGRNISTPGFSYPHYNNTYTLYVVRNGKGSLETDGKKYNLRKNDAFLTRPNLLSIQTSDEKDNWELCFIAFGGTAAEEIIKKTVFKDNNVIVSLKDDSLAEQIINATINLNSGIYSSFLLFEYFFKFLAFFDPLKNYPSLEYENSQNKYISEIKQYIHTNYPKLIKISEMANLLNINRSHLYRIFKKEMGIGIEDYIINIRINHAKVLLKDTSFSVSDVATLIGYKNYTTFFKRFKLVTGVTPIEYRNNTQN